MRFKAPSPVLSHPIRVCAIQYALRSIRSAEAFAEQVETFVDVGDDYDADLLVFPELLSVQLLGCLARSLRPSEAMVQLAERHTETYDALFTRLSRDYGRIIVAGSHPRFLEGQLMNVASVFFPGLPPVHQPKVHLTPGERNLWQFQPGQEINLIDTDLGRFAVLVCYDVQFPETARFLCEAGTELLVVPYLTDDRRGYGRVTTCARARAIENQVYVVTAGMVGSLPLMPSLTSQYAQSGIYTPLDFAFPPEGIATEASPNTEMTIVADLDLAILDRVRASGSVLNHADAATDALHVQFDGELKTYDRRSLLEETATPHDPGGAG